ncbi:MAG: 4Fe-4S dicluster domain-containing protein [Ruminococcaceae bacterium]|nr:4Fe-4S dicluster domain-containing protein [Oscillospiraceae bacterium]
MKKLGFGLMRLPLTDANDAKSINIPALCEMVDAFIANGFTYFDTAWMYCGGKSEDAVNEVLTKRYPRDAFSVTSKLPGYKIKSFEDRDIVFAEQLRKTGLEFFDYYFLHNVNSESLPTFEGYDCFGWIKEKKEKGFAKKIGFSFHDGPGVLDEVLTKYPFFDVVQLQINYLDWESAVQSRACYEIARKHGKDIIVMEPVKGGTLANVPKKAEDLFKSYNAEMSVPSWAIRFAASLDGVITVLSGMSNMEQLCDNMGYMKNFVPLTDEEIKLVHTARDIINSDVAIKCTGCEYCIVNCPQNIAIPKYFSLYNQNLTEAKTKKWTVEEAYYERLAANFGKASDCIACGQCESMCPQHLPIIEHLKEVAKTFEK